MKIKVLVLVSIFISTALFAQSDWKTYEKDNYSIQYPPTWEYSDRKPQPSVQFVIQSEIASQDKDSFRENINLTTEPIDTDKVNLESYYKAGLDQLVAQIPTAKIMDKKPIKLGEKNAMEIMWSADFGNDLLLQFKQVFVLNNGKAYVLTFSSSKSEYDKYIKDGEQILYSFKLKD